MQGVDMRQNRAEGNAFVYNQGGAGCPADGAVVTGVEAATTSNDTFEGRVYIAPVELILQISHSLFFIIIKFTHHLD